jgi:hypothetical protein
MRKRKRNYNKNITEGEMLVWFFLLAIFVVSTINKYKEYLFIFIYIILAIGIYFIARKIWKKNKPMDFSVVEKEMTEINSEKHGCKCYMESLSAGEQEVANLLSQELSYKDYFLFNNLILPSENNISTQVDHVVVSKFGIFVIESKDYQGWISGNGNQKTWTQSLPRGENKFQFQNPIHQNYAHIMALKSLLSFVNDCFYNIVVFSGKSEFKTEMPENVLNLYDLIDYIKKHTQEKMTDENFQLVIGRLSFLCQTVDISAEQHVANLHAKL